MIYIIGILLLLILTVFLIDKRERMGKKIKLLKEKKHEIEALNNQLDEAQYQLNEMNSSLDQLNQISQKILNYRK